MERQYLCKVHSCSSADTITVLVLCTSSGSNTVNQHRTRSCRPLRHCRCPPSHWPVRQTQNPVWWHLARGHRTGSMLQSLFQDSHTVDGVRRHVCSFIHISCVTVWCFSHSHIDSNMTTYIILRFIFINLFWPPQSQAHDSDLSTQYVVNVTMWNLHLQQLTVSLDRHLYILQH